MVQMRRISIEDEELQSIGGMQHLFDDPDDEDLDIVIEESTTSKTVVTGGKTEEVIHKRVEIRYTQIVESEVIGT